MRNPRNHGKGVPNFSIDRVGIILAVGSGVLIGASFVFKKKGLLSSQKGKVAGEGLGYLKSVGSMREGCCLVLIEGLFRLCGGRE